MHKSKDPLYTGWERYYDAIDPVDSTPYIARSAYIDFYTGLIRSDTRALLDLGCGTGSVTAVMARRIVAAEGPTRIVGVDESPTMVAIAKQRYPKARWLVGDMRDPPVDGPFDLIMVCCQTLQVFTEQADLGATFRAARERLAPRGRFAFDIYNPNLPFLLAYPSGRIVRRFTGDDGRAFHIREEGFFEEKTMVLRLVWHLYDSESGAPIDLRPLVMHMRQYLPNEIRQSAQEAGLQIQDYFGELDSTPFNPAARRQVVVCAASE
jgi:SAM-dependent methyltransferase